MPNDGQVATSLNAVFESGQFDPPEEPAQSASTSKEALHASDEELDTEDFVGSVPLPSLMAATA